MKEQNLKAFVFFKGRSIIYKDRGEILLLKFAQELEEHGVLEKMPELQGKKMTIIINPKKEIIITIQVMPKMKTNSSAKEKI